MKKDLISFSTFSHDEIQEIFSLTRWLKEKPRPEFKPLAEKTAALIFEKPSLRTHVSFEVGVCQLGGQSVFLSQQGIGLATRESVRDIAEVLSEYNDLIVARTMKHKTVEDLGVYARIPVVNALTDLLHPCQILADAYTLIERGLFSEKTKIAFIGDGNNVVHSWLELAEKVPFHFVLACPEGYEPDAAILRRARQAGRSKIEIVHDPLEAARDADVLYTDVWTSMGLDEEKLARQKALQHFQINQNTLRVAGKNCVVMHCLPAQKAIMAHLVGQEAGHEADSRLAEVLEA